jgi:aryl-alcohol dehydrogenase-like predicted oxidoreductase
MEDKTMIYRLFGRSGLRVSKVALGTMTFGEGWGDFSGGTTESERIFHAYVVAGGNFIDTANGYMDGQSEELVGRLIAPMRDRIVLATKFGFTRRENDPNSAGAHRKSLVQALDASLKRLKTDYVDLYWMHLWDRTTPLDELMRALDDQVRIGKVLHVGFSDAPAWVVARANTMAMLRGWTPFCGIQIEYNLIERSVERELVPMARAFDLAIAAWSPLATGLLTGKYRNRAGVGDGVRARLSERRSGSRSDAIVDAVSEIARSHGVAPALVALAWLAARGPDVFPILGAKTLAQYEENMRFLELTLTPHELEQLDRVSAIESGFPHQFLADVRSGKMPGGLWGVPIERIDYAETTLV